MHCGFKGSDQAQPVLCEFQAKPLTKDEPRRKRPARFSETLSFDEPLLRLGAFRVPIRESLDLGEFCACNKQSEIYFL